MNEIEKREQELRVNFIKELMMLPLDKKTRTIKFDDVDKIIHSICIQLQTANPNFMKELIILSDKEIMGKLKKK